MKKFLCKFLVFCLVFTFASCVKPSTSNEVSSKDDIVSYTSSEEILNDKISVANNQKIFKHLGVTMPFPKDWVFEEFSGEDGSTYYFKHPNLGEKCMLSVTITGAVYAYDIKKDEYLDYLIDLTGEDSNAKIDSFTKERLSGYDCTKIVSSYSFENDEIIRINYDNVVVGIRMYDFTIIYPVNEKQTVEQVFQNIMNSVEFTED